VIIIIENMNGTGSVYIDGVSREGHDIWSVRK